MNQTERAAKQRKILEMEESIRSQMEILIPKMQEMARGYNLRDERTPFRNVLNVATDPGSGVEVTKNFILYQLGRRDANPIWKNYFRGKNQRFKGKKFAIALVGEIDGLKEKAREVLERVGENLDTDSGKGQLQQVHRRLMQLYLGNLGRYQVFLASESRENNRGQNRNRRRGHNQQRNRNVR